MAKEKINELLDRVKGADFEAMFELGCEYRAGVDVELNYNKMEDLWTLAADNGLITAQFALAEVYEKGRILPQNFDLALKYYRMALAKAKEMLKQDDSFRNAIDTAQQSINRVETLQNKQNL